MQYDVFISYSRKDTEEANRICKAFDEVGITYFIDRQGISGGFEFPTVLAEAIINCKIFLYLASKNSYESRFTQSEITFAFNEKPKGSILPYIIDGSTMPPALRFVFSNINWRRLEEHPINTILVDDLLHLLGKKRVSIRRSADRNLKDANTLQSPSLPTDTFNNKKTYTVNGVSFTMVRIAGGTFTMGASSSDSDAYSNEKPAHQVTLSSYSIGETAVTQALWQAVMGSNPSHFTGNLQRPVEQVSWNDCQEFIRKLNSLTGITFRLPTEAEWEYAARGGSQSHSYKYSGSDNLDSVAWYGDNSSDTTHSVKGKLPNELGLYDMSGNVCEWCSDWYDSSYYASSPQSHPKGPDYGPGQVSRGGSWDADAWNCRVSRRGYSTTSSTDYRIGLRLVS